MLSRFLKQLAAMTTEGSSLVKTMVGALASGGDDSGNGGSPYFSDDRRHLVREAFARDTTVPVVRAPKTNLHRIVKALRPLTLDLRSVLPDPHDDMRKMVLLDPDKVEQRDRLLTSEGRACLEEERITMPPTESHSLRITYDMLSVDGAMRTILPTQHTVSSFATIGHIIHVNLKDELLPYKFLIGQILLDKNKEARTVVNKLQTIDNTFRNFQMELLAGEEDYIATVKENGAAYQLDFSKVYWNSRLSTEHQRIVQQLTGEDVLYDLFAGIGPFAIPAARRGCHVFANDLNPHSFHWLKVNTKANESKRKKLSVECHNMDARQFFRDVVRSDYWQRVTDPDKRHGRLFVVMNLPALAVEFLDSFRDLVDPASVQEALGGDWGRLRPLHVRCYCFLRDEETPRPGRGDPWDVSEMTLSTVEAVALRWLGLDEVGEFSVRFVRNVAVSKNMHCAEFTLTPEHLRELCARHGEDEKEAPAAAKRQKISASGE